MTQRARKDRRPKAGRRIILSRKTFDKIAAQADSVEDFAKKILAAGNENPACEIPHGIPAGSADISADRAINKSIGKILARPKRSRAKNPHTARVRELLAATLRDEIVQSVPVLVQTYLIGAMKIYQAEHNKWARNGTCTVTNDVGSKTSNAATVTVNAAGKPPVINSQLQSITVAQGNTFTLAVTASGTGLSYQWKKNGANIAGATSRTYSKVAATTDNGNYTVTVSNAYGSTPSSAVTVTVTTSGGNTGGNNNSSSGGGGGGGAPSFLYVAGLAIAGLLKRLAKR
ncbi:immunoglobulin domain-containing protein [Ereboglobus luteus]|nr:immunoglobulin domain-containing protein [Ereboglobus luteus]